LGIYYRRIYRLVLGSHKMINLRHMKLPMVLIYRDPKRTWDKGVKEYILEEIKKDQFQHFVETEISLEEYIEQLMEYL